MNKPLNTLETSAMLEELDDNALYLMYRDNNQAAFAVLVDRYRPILASYLTTTLRVSDPTTRDSVAQAVFEQLAGVADKFNAGTSSVAGWMFWLAKNRLKSI